MTALNKGIRGSITTNVMRYRFHKEISKWEKKHNELALRVYKDVYPLTVRKEMENQPKGWLPETYQIAVKMGNSIETLMFSGAMHGATLSPFAAKGKAKAPVTFRVPYKDFGTSRYDLKVVKVYASDHKLSKAMTELFEAKTELIETVTRAHILVAERVHSVNTVKKLLEDWPEVAPFVPDTKKPSNLPSLPIEQLNAVLDLPA